MPSLGTGRLLQQSPACAALGARKVETLAAAAVEEVHRTRGNIVAESEAQ